jgi:hypothetical protein
MNNVLKIDGTNWQDEPIEQAPREDVVIFENQGEIDMRAVTTMGISAKDKSDAIGYFGTGLKYAIAVLLREGCEIVVNSGNQKYIFEKKSIDFRGKKFEIITMNGVELPFTTELGKNWKVWQAFRELYCNCTDESGRIFKAFSEVEGSAGKTVIIAKGAEIVKAYDERKVVILETPFYLKDSNVQVHLGHSHHLYYRGIRVYDIKHSLFTYNLTTYMELTEDRTIKWFWKPRGIIMNMVLTSTDKEFIRTILTAQEGTYERDFNFTDTTEATATPSAEFLEVADILHAQADNKGNLSAIAVSSQYRHKTAGNIRGVASLTSIQNEQLRKATELSKKMGFDIDEYPVIVTDALGSTVLGLAEGETIYISTQAFTYGAKTVAQTLIEEYIHLKHGFEDECRAMQNYLFGRLVDLGTELHQEVL